MSQCSVDNCVHNFCGEEAVNSLVPSHSTPGQYYSDRDLKIMGRPSQVGQRPQLLSQFDRRDALGPVGAMTDRGTPPGRNGRFAMGPTAHGHSRPRARFLRSYLSGLAIWRRGLLRLPPKDDVLPSVWRRVLASRGACESRAGRVREGALGDACAVASPYRSPPGAIQCTSSGWRPGPCRRAAVAQLTRAIRACTCPGELSGLAPGSGHSLLR